MNQKTGMLVDIPSGDAKIAIENGPVEIVDLPIENGDFHWFSIVGHSMDWFSRENLHRKPW